MTNKEIIQKMYADFAQGNIPGVLEAMGDNIVIDTPGPAIIPSSGVRSGKSGAMDFFQAVGSAHTYRKFEAEDLICDGDKVTAVGHADITANTTGKEGSARWIMVWTLKDGKAVHVVNQWDTAAVAATLMQ